MPSPSSEAVHRSAKRDIVVDRVHKVFGAGESATTALDGISFQIEDGEFISLIGPSGCGKTTLLYMIAGFHTPSAGEVLVSGQPVTSPGADRGMMFQEYCLFPWLTVQGNVEFGLRIKGIAKSERHEIANSHIRRVGLDGFQNRYPHQLSGGMKQRCALARCFANDANILLLDEPLGAVDAMTREELQDEIQDIWWDDDNRRRKTVVNVTHSIDESVYLSDRIIVMSPRPGRVREIIEIPFERPRRPELRFEPEYQRFVAYVHDLLKSFKGH
ncbi:ABC transporter ATP-binding protein [Oceanibacterium hippocampi]|uniref:Bicarbonate transport ATP-binding protein CmpD n=1 Tax=Oceanibacterium hippocampi TaxID=745714 RepID=A0A1Y5TK20_9PROT|nr:ABC transporter ATP-binding protein [Oceanibacterium hippocampi]SLN65431.1 Bicarbonate transport ATP-binding protein CmpD [Oceanibacterium hippocampi]